MHLWCVVCGVCTAYTVHANAPKQACQDHGAWQVCTGRVGGLHGEKLLWGSSWLNFVLIPLAADFVPICSLPVTPHAPSTTNTPRRSRPPFPQVQWEVWAVLLRLYSSEGP